MQQTVVTETPAPIYIKDAPPRVFDTHVHFPWRKGANGPLMARPESIVEALVYTCERLNIRKVCLLGRWGESNDLVEQTAARYPRLIVPFAQSNPDEDTPELIGEYKARGFRGLKIINPRRNYDHPSYFPLYATAEEAGLVILFHTGISGGPIDYLQFPPSSEEVSIEVSRRFEGLRRYKPGLEQQESWYGAGRMQPVWLDGVSVAFPELKIIGAHLGYGLYDSAAAVARWRRNVYFDISGGAVVRRHLIERGMIRAEVSPRKLTWGSDCDIAHISRELTGWMQDFARIGLTAQEQDDIFWGTAARLFGYTD